jgi:hypothetical protein
MKKYLSLIAVAFYVGAQAQTIPSSASLCRTISTTVGKAYNWRKTEPMATEDTFIKLNVKTEDNSVIVDVIKVTAKWAWMYDLNHTTQWVRDDMYKKCITQQ